MRHFADPHRCPDCGSALPAGRPTCSTCHLELSGPLAGELFATLTRADELLQQLRRGSRSAVAGAGSPVETSTAPAYALAKVRSATSVPKILLALGTVCLLVAALVFLAFAWSDLGVGGRTATLVAFTGTTGALTGWMAARGLRAATEALGLVTLGLIVLDLYGAAHADWLGDRSDAGLTAVAGAVLVATGLTATWLLSRTAAAAFIGGELAATLGAGLLSVGVAAQGWGSSEGRLLLVVLVALALTTAVRMFVRDGAARFRVAGWGLAVVTTLDWLALVLGGLDTLLGDGPTMTSAWVRFGAWPLVAAAALGLLVAASPRLAPVIRSSSAAAGLVPLGFALLAPALDENRMTLVLCTAALTAAVAVLMALAPSPWGQSGLAAAFLGGLALTVVVLELLAVAVDGYRVAASAAWSGTPSGRLVGAPELGSERLLLPLCAAVLLGLGWAVARLANGAPSAVPATRASAMILAATGVATMLLYPVPVWTVIAAALVVSVVVAAPALRRDDLLSAVLCTVGLGAAVVLSWYDEQLTAATLSTVLVLAASIALRTRRHELAAACAGVVAVVVAGLAWTSTAVVGAPPGWAAFSGLIALAVLVLGRPLVPIGLRGAGAAAVLEVTAAGSAAALAGTALVVLPAADRSTWLAMYLTVAGAAAVLLSLLRRDRRPAAWLGGLLLAAATWVRLGDLGVDEPEPYTLPTALALLVVGLLRLRRDSSLGTHQALGAGLLLALLPSTLWTLVEPGDLRSLLVGLACLGLVVGGAQRGWLAPLVHGAAAGVVVVLVEAGPHVGEAVPRWALIGAAGALLIALGVTWEQRLREARLWAAYVRELR